jgi:1-acyl-sn-glycerol-3-phosphate acyltransferase
VPDALSAQLADLSAREIADALGVQNPLPRALVIAAARVPSMRLGRTLARFDRHIARDGVAPAARATLTELGARIEVDGALPSRGGVLIVTNHPGAYDALAMIAASGRNDVALFAKERAFLRALPNLTRHLVFLDESSAIARAAGIRRALGWLAAGHVLIHYGAGAIEPDLRFDEGAVLGEWRAGTGVLATRAPCVVPAFVSGVHSPRAKRLPFVRWAERRGVTTIAPLVQATVPGFRDVRVSVRFGPPIDLGAASDYRARTALIRQAVARLYETRRCTTPRSEASHRTRAHSPRAHVGEPSSG